MANVQTQKSDQLETQKGQRVVVAMSGGVDSCAAAMMLHDQGFEVIGVSMQVWDYRKNGGNSERATCCAPADFDDAREVAERLDFPYYVFDFEESFHKSVIAPFVDSYLKGQTPNPCLDCNRHVKFKELRRRAASLGAGVVATGHYAQVRPLEDGSLGLFTSVDGNKDQSYFLYAMTQEDLKTTVFPVGAMNKSEVRDYLAERDFSVAQKAESQDICFVGSTVGKFIQKQSGVGEQAGRIVDAKGQKLGDHEGIYNYTVGQRRGLGVSAPNPLYVLNIDADSNDVVVGEKSELEQENFLVREVSWISGEPLSSALEVQAKLRYRHDGVRCRVEPIEDEPNSVKVSFLDSWSSVSPGQAAVFYAPSLEADGTVQLLGGGIIRKDSYPADTA